MNLILPVKRKWFEQIESGEKTEEYRIDNEYWQKRIIGKSFEKVIITLGYPKREDSSRRLEFPWNGYVMRSVVSEEWGNKPVRVFTMPLWL